MTIESDYLPYAPLSLLPQGPVLVLAPHADDEVIGCGGALAQHVKRGDRVKVVIMTDGAAATEHESTIACAQYQSRRLQESHRAAQILGYEAPVCLGIPDRQLQCHQELRSLVLSLAQEADASTIYAPSVQEVHPDHHALGMAICHATRQLNPCVTLMFYEVGYPAAINALVDITEDIATKRDALLCFESQLQIRDYVTHMEALNVYRTYTLDRAVKAAEGYLCVSAADVVNDPKCCLGRSRVTDAFQAQYKQEPQE